MSQILLHIGFGKGGTKYLQQWFAEHPAMYYQPKYIAGGFINALTLAKYVESVEKIPEVFVMSCEDLAVWESQVNIYGLRGTRPYDYRKFQSLMCEMLYGIYPTAKVMMVTRGYTSIFNSIYSMYLAKTGTFTFKQLADNLKEMFSIMHDYTYMINLYRNKFGYENVIILPYELLRDDSVRFLSLIEDRMQVKETFAYPPEKVHAAYDKNVLLAYHKVSLFVFKMLMPFPDRWRDMIYLQYAATFGGAKAHPLMKFLSRFMQGTINTDGMQELLESVKGRAEVLRNEELFAPYLKDYLL